MGCIPPLRAVSKIQFHKMRSAGQSLVHIMGSTPSSRTKVSPRFHGSSGPSANQDLELKDSCKQPHNEKTLLYGEKGLSVAGTYPKT